MSKVRIPLIIVGMLLLCVASSIGTYFSLLAVDAIKEEPIRITIELEDKTKAYDGTELKADSYEITEGTLISGHVLDVEYLGSQTNYGKTESSIDIKVFDNDNFDVTDNYSFNIVKGDISITKRPILIKIDDLEQEYDGKDATAKSYTIQEGTFVTGHRFIPNYSDLESSKVYDAVGNDVTDNYNLSFLDGNIVINPIKITISPESLTKVYDGTSLTPTKIVLNSGSLLEGQYIDGKIEGSILNEGEIYASILSYDIYDKDGQIVDKKYYDVTTNTGVLTILKRDLIINMSSASKVFDGKELVNEQFTISEDTKLAPGDTFKVLEYTSSITDYGTTNNTIASYDIYNDQNLVVTKNYNVIINTGTLSIEKRNVKVYGQSAVYEYNGEYQSLNDKECELAEGLIDGDAIEVTYEGQIMNVGSIENRIISYNLTRGNEANYNFELINGTITITKRNVSFEFDELPTKTYDGNKIEITTNQIEANTLVKGHIFEIVDYTSIIDGSESDKINLRQVRIYENNIDVTANYEIDLSKAETEYVLNKRDLEIYIDDLEVEFSENLTINENKIYSISSKIPLISGDRIYSITFNYESSDYKFVIGENTVLINKIVIYNSNNVDITKNYNIISNQGTVNVLKKVINIELMDLKKEYDGNEFPETTYIKSSDAPTGLVIKFTPDSFVSNVKDVIKTTYSGTCTITGSNIDNYIINIKEGQIEITPIELTIEGDSKTFEYNGTYQSLPDSTKTIGKYTVTIVYGSSLKDVGSTENLISSYTISKGGELEDNNNYNVTIINGTLTVTKAKITVNFVNNVYFEKTYDGTPLVVDKDTLVVKGIMDIHTFILSKYTKIIFDGEYDRLKIEEIIIYDEFDLDVTENYEIDYTNAVTQNFSINLRQLIIVGNTLVFDYDENLLETLSQYDNKYFYNLSNFTPIASTDIIDISGIMVEYTTNPGFNEVIIDADRIYIQNLNVGVNYQDVTGMYEIIVLNGSININKQKVNVTLQSLYKVYDGASFVAPTTYILNSNFKDSNIIIEESFIGELSKIKDVISTPYTININVYVEGTNEKGEDILINITQYYDISIVQGSLVIEKASITVIGLSEEYLYDGSAHSTRATTPASVIGIDISRVSVTYNASLTNAGTISNTISSITVDEIENNENYSITLVLGTLTVKKRSIIVITDTEYITYTDTASLVGSRYRIIDSNEPSIEYKLRFTFVAATGIGTTQNICYASNSEASNYDIVYIYGNLIIT